MPAPLPRPSFQGSYLVTAEGIDRTSIGVVRRDTHVWRIFRFGVPAADQPVEVFETREAAGRRLIELATG